MKKSLLLVTILSLGLFSCSKDGGKEEIQEEKKVFEVVIYNDMDLSRTNTRVSDGVLYNVTLGTTKGELLEINRINNGNKGVFTMSEQYTKYDQFVVFMKYLPSGGGNLSNQGYMCMYSGDEPVLFQLNENKPVEIYITENTRFITSNYTHKSDLQNIMTAAGL